MRYNGYFVKTTGTSFKPVFIDLAGWPLCNFCCVTHLYCTNTVQQDRETWEIFQDKPPGVFIFTVTAHYREAKR